MFRKEDYVVYGDLGVCQVQDIVERKFDGLDKAHLYYVLAPVYQDGVLYVPADNPRIFLRAVISAEEANRLIDQIPTMEGKAFHSRSSQELSAHYEEAMRTHSCADLIRLTMSIHTNNTAFIIPYYHVVDNFGSMSVSDTCIIRIFYPLDLAGLQGLNFFRRGIYAVNLQNDFPAVG